MEMKYEKWVVACLGGWMSDWIDVEEVENDVVREVISRRVGKRITKT